MPASAINADSPTLELDQHPTIVVCDDEELIRWSLCQHLEGLGYPCVAVENGKAAVEAVRKHSPGLVLMDQKMPVMDGLAALRTLRESGLDVPVVMITAHGAVDSAIEATRLGAAAYLSKPFDLREVTLVIERTLAEVRLRQEVHYLRGRDRQGYGDFVGKAASLEPVYRVLGRLEQVDSPTVLITGESGTGKDVLARMVHARGPRADKPFVEVDCAALPETLIESELFGHERGSFTDARQTKRGLFEVAHGGVVFLDEIGEMTLATQAKLLRALENRSFRRVGGTAKLSMNVTLIAATNRDLKAEVDAGRFREDLFFRLNVVPIKVPPLRERAEDVPVLVQHFVQKFSRDFGRRFRGVDGEAMEMLKRYSWPGNVRELRNVLERIIILGADGEVLKADDLPPEIRYARAGTGPSPVSGCPFVLPEGGVDLELVDRGLLVQALDRSDGNQSAAARLLGISRYALRYRMEKHGLK